MLNLFGQRKAARGLLKASLSVLALSTVGGAISVASAQTQPAVTAEPESETVVVITATRRESTVQDAPINIAAVTSAQLKEQGLGDLAEAAAWVPSVHLVDQGGRTADRIVVRGLNVDPLAQTDVIGNNAGGAVATYIGETPTYIDLKLNDIDRVEFLLGPQGTLYGKGTLGGAIRYIPKQPTFGETLLEVRGDVYGYSESGSLSTSRGLTFNKGLGPHLAVRGSIDKLEDSGFVDYNYVVRAPGVTNPNDIDPLDSAYDLTPVEDANSEDTTSGRVALRWAPVSWLDSNFTYYFQHEHSGARTVSNKSSALPGAGDYVAPQRVLEPNSRDNKLYAWENKLDLGFAELTSSTAFSKFKERGKRDQSPLLITLEYSYEAFPAFTAFTREEQEDKTFTQEMRLVSKSEGPLSWILGGFYSNFDSDSLSKEFTPGFSQYNLDNGAPGVLRPDALEYIEVSRENLKEKAVYGELTYEFTPKWQVTGGLRWYKYDLSTADATDLPLYATTIDPDGRLPDEIDLSFNNDGQSDDGVLYKLNTSYKFSEDALAYFTISEGYRVGGGNGVVPCAVVPPPSQTICGLPNELSYSPDKTQNFELGAHTQWFDKRLTLNGSVYYIKWDQPQLVSATTYGSATITKNGEGAKTEGFDLAAIWKATDDLTFRASYAYTKAELTALAPCLVATIPTQADQLGAPPFSYDCPADAPTGNFQTVFNNGQDGDRLPGSPEHQFSFFAKYSKPIGEGVKWSVNYGVTAISDVLARTGSRGGFPKLDGYAVSNLSTGFTGDSWDVTLYAQNLFDEYGETGLSGNSRYDDVSITDGDGGPVYVRSYYANPIAPRAIGVRFSKSFGE